MYELIKKLSVPWQKVFLKFANETWFNELSTFLSHSDFSHILPAKENILKAFTFSDPQAIKVIILGQDPYINREQATGLAFGVPDNSPLPPSLQNIFSEVKRDYQEIHTKSDLVAWAEQGVLLLNVTLTVIQGQSNSHAHLPWKDLVFNVLNELLVINDVCAMLLWGNFARKIFDHLILKPAFTLLASHPSPLSYHRSFSKCHHFKQVNDYLKLRQLPGIVW